MKNGLLSRCRRALLNSLRYVVEKRREDLRPDDASSRSGLAYFFFARLAAALAAALALAAAFFSAVLIFLASAVPRFFCQEALNLAKALARSFSDLAAKVSFSLTTGSIAMVEDLSILATGFAVLDGRPGLPDLPAFTTLAAVGLALAGRPRFLTVDAGAAAAGFALAGRPRFFAVAFAVAMLDSSQMDR